MKQDKLGEYHDKDCGNQRYPIESFFFVSSINKLKYLLIFLLLFVEIVDVPVGCIYNRCHATCKGYEEIPRDLSAGIDRLYDFFLSSFILLFHREKQILNASSFFS